MKGKRLTQSLFAAAVIFASVPFSLGGTAVTVLAQEETNFSYETEVLENASFGLLDFIDSEVYCYTPSQQYRPAKKMMPLFFVYVDEPLKSKETAWTKLKESGLLDLAEQQKAGILLINPLDGENYTADDYDQWLTLAKCWSGSRDIDFDYTLPTAENETLAMLKTFIIGEGKGADFVAQYLTNDVASGITAGTILVNANTVPEISSYAIPAYLVNCSDSVVQFYREMNGAEGEGELNGNAVYYNSDYVMDSGYTPKRLIVSSEETEKLNKGMVEKAWEDLLRRVWKSPLVNNFFTEGTETGVVLDRPIVDEMNLTMNEVTGEETDGTGQSRWYEWVPNEVYDTMENGTGEEYPLIVVLHGNTDHEIFSAEGNGWVDLADKENVIVVAPLDIYELGMPPEMAENRYGTENAEWILNTICGKYPVDRSRIYVTGFSIGAFTAAETAAAMPELFAACAPIAYPADQYLQIFPIDEYGGEEDAAAYDLPYMTMNGGRDWGNTTKNPQDESQQVMAQQLLFNQLLSFNEMEDQKLDLVDFEYDWFPGENDPKADKKTGEVTGGYDFWDGTAAAYILQNLDFEAYPFYGFDINALPNTSFGTFQTEEGISVEQSIFYNQDDFPMLEYLKMGDMGHQLYNRYAQIIWKNFFSHYSRNPETGVLSYDGTAASK